MPGNILYVTDSNSKFEILSDISIMNHFLCVAKKLCSIKTKYNICVDEIVFDGHDASYIEVCPYTNTGKNAKFPIIVHYRTQNYDIFDPPDNYFGDIYYFADGTIGKATLINWVKKKSLIVNLKTIGGELIVSKVESIDTSGQKQMLYNINQKKESVCQPTNTL